MAVSKTADQGSNPCGPAVQLLIFSQKRLARKGYANIKHMEKFSIVNLNEFTWQLNVALMGGVFAVFSLIYNEYYIYYGLTTFSFGVSGHIIYKFCEWVFGEDGTKNKYYWLTHLFNCIVAAAWINIILCIY